MDVLALLRGASRRAIITAAVVGFVAIVLIVGYLASPHAGAVKDEAKLAGREASSFPASNASYFDAMDGGHPASDEQRRGRNTWIVWTGGNDRFWDRLSTTTFGNFDLLKVLSSYPGLKYSRDTRWSWLGLVNEPCFDKATGPDPKRYGLWLDVRRSDCPADPFANEVNYPGVKIGARGKTVPVGSYYGYPSGIIGLRLFPNPAFDKAAARKWDPVRYYTDPSYFNSATLVRPYRVGMSCGFCHVGPSPVKPPADPEHPKWENLSATAGNQYFWVDRIFSWQADSKNYLYQLFHTSRPGALDTSLVSTDYINNPRTMNAVYNLQWRLDLAKSLGKETLAGGNLNNKQLPGEFMPPSTVFTPHVLKDGADSVGALGALNRVYLNIGLFSEEWLLHFNAFVGLKQPSPIRITVARRNSSYWNATEAQTPAMAQYLVWAGVPDKLAAAPGGAAQLGAAPAMLTQGKVVFAERCARCHSSKLPPIPAGDKPSDCSAPGYLNCWNRYWSWTKTEAFKSPMRQLVAQPDFLDQNFLSTDIRVPASLLRPNLCSPLATNAIQGKIWDDFSSKTYKDLPSVGKLTVVNPITGQPRVFDMPAGGRGYTRPASLVSLWATAPYLLNNSVGHFEENPDVASRMRAFNDGMHQMLWPETRTQDAQFPQAGGEIDRLPNTAYLSIPSGFLPGVIQWLIKPLSFFLPDLFVAADHPYPFSGHTVAGSTRILGVRIAPNNAATDIPSFTPGTNFTTFAQGAPVKGPGIAPGARVVRFDAAAGVLEISRPANATLATTALQTMIPERGVRAGPLRKGTPVNLLAALELTPDKSDLWSRARQDIALVNLLLAVDRDAGAIRAAKTAAAGDQAYARLENDLYSMSKCPDYQVNRGHYFGTSLLPDEPGLSDSDKTALIAFLKTF